MRALNDTDEVIEYRSYCCGALRRIGAHFAARTAISAIELAERTCALTGFVPWNSAAENAKKIQFIGEKILNLWAIVQGIK
jgi:hypothetical protein